VRGIPGRGKEGKSRAKTFYWNIITGRKEKGRRDDPTGAEKGAGGGFALRKSTLTKKKHKGGRKGM